MIKLRQRPDLDITTIVGQSFVPTLVWIGKTSGFSLPVTNESDHEWLTLTHSVPRRWDRKSDICLGVLCAINTANTNKKFQLRFDWEHFTVGDVVPATSNPVPVEITTGTDAQYKSYVAEFTIDYDIDGGDLILAGDELSGRPSRIAATENEIAGEVIIIDYWLGYYRGYYGGA